MSKYLKLFEFIGRLGVMGKFYLISKTGSFGKLEISENVYLVVLICIFFITWVIKPFIEFVFSEEVKE